MPLFIIFGISSKEKARSAGSFQCPVCETTRDYSELRISRYFSLFFIPILPLGSTSTGRIVCNHCRSEFSQDVV